MARVEPGQIDYVNAHSTSTPVGDAAEIAALRTIFSDRGKDLAVSSTKSSTGHLLGAAGALEAVYSIKALQTGVVPAGLNIDAPVEAADVFDLVPNAPKEKRLDSVLSNAFGFGGVNASVVFRRVA